MTNASSRDRPAWLALLVGLVVGAVACTPANEGPAATPSTTLAAATPSTTVSALPPLAVAPTAPAETTEAPSSSAAAPSNSAAAPSPIAEAAADAPAPKPFAMNLARRGDFVAQYTFEWCVGASLQMALNMATDQQRTTKSDQRRLWAMARDRSFSPFGGANPRGWTVTLNELGIGPYQLVSLPTFDEAVVSAAAAIRETKRPVGLVMWRGRHAWVMSGFEATADPRRHADFEVTRVRVHDPLYPHGSSVWGSSPRPNSLIDLDTLAEQFVIRDRGRVDLGVPPGYLLVLPVTENA